MSPRSEEMKLWQTMVSKETVWNCDHGISNTVPCADCFRFSKGRDLRDRSRDWKAGWEGGME